MQLSILAIGKMKSGPEAELLKRYIDRCEKTGRQLGFSGPKIYQWNESSANSADLRKCEESKLLAGSVKPGASLICLDEQGNDISSLELADLMRTLLDNSIPQICFAIGGPDGHSQAFRDNCAQVIRFGKMTWPHQFVRVMLAEQLYRAITILSGHPYHRV